MTMQLYSSKKMIERKMQRTPTYRAIEVYDEDGCLLEKGTLRDWSRQGALIILETTPKLPKTIVICFPQDSRGYKADVRWREEKSIGVRFDEEMEQPEWLQKKKDRIEVVAAHLLPAQARHAL